jgi:hypothetical protein
MHTVFKKLQNSLFLVTFISFKDKTKVRYFFFIYIVNIIVFIHKINLLLIKIKFPMFVEETYKNIRRHIVSAVVKVINLFIY